MTGIQGIRQQLAQIQLQGGTPKEQTDKYRTVLDQIHKADDHQFKADGLKAYVESIVNENVSLVISRQLLTEVSNSLITLPVEMSKDVSHFTLERIQPRVVSFEEQVGLIRQHLANIYENENRWRDAAQVLVSMNDDLYQIID